MKIYVASSWRNNYQPIVVTTLRHLGYDVYDFKDSEGFRWSEIDPEWRTWTPAEYIKGLTHPYANRGFIRDMQALRDADVCIYVMPCGVSASLEAGWACGAGKYTMMYVPDLRDLREPDLMVKMFDVVTNDLQLILKKLAQIK